MKTRRDFLKAAMLSVPILAYNPGSNAYESSSHSIPKNPWENTDAKNLEQFYRLSNTKDSGVEIYGNLENITKQDKKFLLKFGATWCSGCRYFDNKIPETLEQRPDLTIITVDVDKQPQISTYYIGANSSIPAFVYLNQEGRVVTDDNKNKIIKHGANIPELLKDIPRI